MIETNGQVWAACRAMRKPELQKVAQLAGYHLREEAARTELRKRAVSVAVAGSDPHTVFHDLEACKCGTCKALRRHGKGHAYKGNEQ
jgi:hypothetical protein